MKIKYFDEKVKNLKKYIESKNSISFNELLNLTGWDNKDLTYVLKKLLDLDIINEFFDEEHEKILYELNKSKDEDMMTIQERIENLEKQTLI